MTLIARSNPRAFIQSTTGFGAEPSLVPMLWVMPLLVT
eukprot:CAMPEP_0176132920 /NCGR_PEP_ID=MMETSP0120_2-20121206/67357_1 /TAXON_ID=160619 /ORGANISM="Kryptoperidinium foliaceum, Strain CCMP 1326" /LENGTH=37 /DNA_ID= /DNA_START= /DNA_END= /DNA_ORIENTATION=